MKKYYIFSIFLFLSTTLFAQPPSTDIFLASLKIENGKVIVSGLKNITRREGYDNQPSFSPDGKSIFFTSIQDSTQSDIYRYYIDGDSTIQVTRTEESEYSPTVMNDGGHFSVVRVEKDSTQRLWKFNLNGTEPGIILKTIKPVGYHCWVDNFRVALFVLGEPITLQVADVKTETADTLATNIGRALHRVPGKNALSFIEKENDSVWYVDEYYFPTKRTKRIIQTLKGSEDLTWLKDGTMLMGNGSALYRFNPATDTAFQQIADFKSDGLTSMTRLAISPDGTRLAIVAIKQ